jgi:hypothetical protein
MAKVRNGELRALIEDALNESISTQTVDPDNICYSVAEVIVRAISDAGIAAIRDDRNRARAMEGVEAAIIAHSRQTEAA